jgi:DNA repair exonuclease SbcCD ATPase subunit
MNWKESAHETINTWKAKIEHARVRINLLQMELKDEYDDRLTQLQRKWQEVEAEMDSWEDSAETRWDKLKREFESDLKDLSESVEKLLTSDDNDERVPAAAGKPVEESEGWVEGMGQRPPGADDYVKGMRNGKDKTDSEGWVEGMGAQQDGVDDYVKGQRTSPKPV